METSIIRKSNIIEKYVNSSNCYVFTKKDREKPLDINQHMKPTLTIYCK